MFNHLERVRPGIVVARKLGITEAGNAKIIVIADGVGASDTNLDASGLRHVSDRDGSL